MIYLLFNKIKYKLLICLFFKEIISVFIFIPIAVYVLNIYEPYGEQTVFWGVIVHYCIGISPVLFIYCFFRIFLRCFFSWFIVVLVICFLSIVNARKTLETKHVLSWGDLTGYENYQIAIRYVDMKMMLLCGAAAFCFSFFYPESEIKV